jgi:hypothetical protein
MFLLLSAVKFADSSWKAKSLSVTKSGCNKLRLLVFLVVTSMDLPCFTRRPTPVPILPRVVAVL